MSRLLCLLLLLTVPVAFAQPGPDARMRTLQEEVAQAAAERELAEDVEQLPVAQGWTVQRFMVDLGEEATLQQEVGQAQIIGGPRWVTRDICQFHLQLDGRRLADVLYRLASDERSPLEREAVWDGTRHWYGRPFMSTGMAIRPAAVVTLRPPAQDPTWRGINDAQRETLIRDAHEAAKKAAIEEGGLEPADAEVQPATRVTFFQQDGHPAVEVELLVPDQKKVFRGTSVDQQAVVAVQAEQPLWVDDRLSATGEIADGKDRLRSGRAAERAAREELARKLEDLAVDGQRLGERAQQDKRVAEALEAAVRRAEVRAITYHTDGRVTAVAEVDAQEVWRLLQ